MRDDKYMNKNNEPFFLIKENVLFDFNVIQMCKYKPINQEFLKQVYVSLNACRDRIRSENKFKTLMALAGRLKNPPIIKFTWDMTVYNVHYTYGNYSNETEEHDINMRNMTADYDEDNNNDYDANRCISETVHNRASTNMSLFQSEGIFFCY